ARDDGHLARGARVRLAPAPGAVAPARRPAVLELDPGDQPAGDALEVPAALGRLEVGVGGAEARAVALGDLRERGAVLLGPVVVVDVGDARRLGGGEPGAHDRARGALVADVQRPAHRVVLGASALVVLRAQEV